MSHSPSAIGRGIPVPLICQIIEDSIATAKEPLKWWLELGFVSKEWKEILLRPQTTLILLRVLPSSQKAPETLLRKMVVTDLTRELISKHWVDIFQQKLTTVDLSLRDIWRLDDAEKAAKRDLRQNDLLNWLKDLPLDRRQLITRCTFMACSFVEFTQAAKVEIVQLLPCLQTLTIDQKSDQRFDEACLDELLRHCPELHTLSVRRCHFEDLRIVRFKEHLPKLQHVEFTECMGQMYPFEALLPVASSLRSLNFNSHCHVETRALTACLQQAALLTSLRLSNSCKIDEATLIDFVQKHPKLTSLTVDQPYFSDALLGALGKHTPELCEFHLSYSDTATDAGVDALKRSCAKIQSLKIAGPHIFDPDSDWGA